MNLQPGHIYHIYNRGNNQESIFFSEANYLYFLSKLRTYLTPHLHILTWCLMPNHFHLLAQVREEASSTGCGATFRTLLSSCTRAIQKQEKRTGSLFQQQTQAKDLLDGSSSYAEICFCYIHQNPLRAGLVTDLAAWRWSSFPDYAGLRPGILCEQELARQFIDLPAEKQDFAVWVIQTTPPDATEAIY